jgi:hypothetical protein
MNEGTGTPVIIFGVLSYRSSSDAISQFADAVFPHKVLVHHDFHQRPEFDICRENVSLIKIPTRTSWGSWSLVEATLMLIEQATAMGQWDYFQLASESCLPVRPIGEFAEYLEHMKPDVMIDMQPLKADSPELMMNYAWRYLPRSPMMRRVARRAGVWCIGRDFNYLEGHGGNIKVPSNTPKTRLDNIKMLIGKKILTSFEKWNTGAFPVGKVNQCWVGSQWFALSRQAALRVLSERKATPELEAHFRRCHIPDESYIQTLVSKCSFNNMQPSNHVTFWKGGGFGPDELTASDLPKILRSKKFFARKFSLDIDCPVRRQILQLCKRSPGIVIRARHNPRAADWI